MKDAFYVDKTMCANGWRRFANHLIDSLVYYLIIFLIGVVAGLFSEYLGMDGMSVWISEMSGIGELVFTYSIMLLYYIFMESLTQKTLGKYITGTIVVMEDGSKPEINVILLRSICRLIPFDGLTFIGEYSRGWHDSLAKSYVVDVNKYNAALRLKNSFEEIGSDQINY